MVSLKTINDKFTIEEWEILNKAKGTKSWHDFILEKCSPCIPAKKKSNAFDIDLGLHEQEHQGIW